MKQLCPRIRKRRIDVDGIAGREAYAALTNQMDLQQYEELNFILVAIKPAN